MDLPGRALGSREAVGEGELLLVTASAALGLVARELACRRTETPELDLGRRHRVVLRHAWLGNRLGQVPDPCPERGGGVAVAASDPKRAMARSKSVRSVSYWRVIGVGGRLEATRPRKLVGRRAEPPNGSPRLSKRGAQSLSAGPAMQPSGVPAWFTSSAAPSTSAAKSSDDVVARIKVRNLDLDAIRVGAASSCHPIRVAIAARASEVHAPVGRLKLPGVDAEELVAALPVPMHRGQVQGGTRCAGSGGSSSKGTPILKRMPS